MTAGGAAPSDRLDAAAWDAATNELVETLRELIRIRSINPIPSDASDGELVAARRIAAMLRAAGLEPEIIEPVPGRGSVHVRLRGDGTGGEPLLLLSHLDVVPAPPERWSHDPFAGDLVDGHAERPYLSATLDDPSFPATIYARLVEGEVGALQCGPG